MSNRATRMSLVALLTAATASIVLRVTMTAAAGQVDPGFGSGGVVVTDFGGQADRASAIVRRPDGSGFYLAGQTEPGSGNRLSIASYNADGTLDTGFGIQGLVTTFSAVTAVGDAALQADGKLVVVGTWGDATTARFFTARFLRDGTLDTSFASGGVRLETFGGAFNIGNAVAIQSDGRILVGGRVIPAFFPDQAAFGLVRYTTGGALDTTFGASYPQGMVTTDFGAGAPEGITRVTVLPDGRILAVGGARDRLFMARYASNGTLDPTFGVNGLVADYSYAEPTALALQADGKIVLGGNNACGYVQRYNADGSIDYSLRILNQPTQLPDGSISCTHSTVEFVNGLALLSSGKIIVAGHTDDGGNKIQLAAHNPNGSFDASFGDAGLSTIDFGQPAVAAGMVLDGARVLVGGTAGSDFGVAAVTGVDSQFAVSFATATFHTTEFAGAATISVRLGAPVQSTVTVDYEASAGTATANADFTPISGTLTFQPGETQQTFAVPVVNDSLVEGTETVVLVLRDAANAVVGAPNPATLVIGDNPTIRFGSAQYQAAEISGTRSIAVTLSGPTNQDATVDYAIAGGTATPNQDYLPVAGTVTIPAGQTIASFDVPILQDNVAEPDETVLLLLSNPHNTALDPSAANPATLTIVDTSSAGTGTVCPSCPRFQVSETAGVLTVTVDATDPFGPPADVAYVTVNGTATAGPDYGAVQGTVRVGAGIRSASFSVPIVRDRVFDPNETFLIAFQSPDAITLGPLAVVTIVDATIVVQSFEQTSGRCTLTSAMQSANSDQAIGGCEKGSGDDLIFMPAGTYLMTSIGSQDAAGNGPNALPIATGTVDIVGEGAAQTVLLRDPSAPAMRFFQSSGPLTLRSLTVRGGRAVDGGAIRANVVITDHVVFEDNVASGRGGVMYGGRLLAESSRFQNNSAGQAGGVMSDGVLDGRNSTFAANRADTYGGVYYGCPGIVTLSNSALTGNSAGHNGGALYSGSCYGEANSVTATDSVFIGNAAGLGQSNGSGGAIEATSPLSITRSRFLNNISVDFGGAISGANGSITGSTFSGNEARQGGAIYSSPNGATLVVRSSTFDGNHAGLQGGALSLSNIQATLANVTISNNRADTYGGGLSYDRSAFPLILSNVTIAGNRAAVGGGGIFPFFFAGPVRLRNSIIALNTTATGTDPDIGLDGVAPLYESGGFNLIGNAQRITWPAAPGDRVGTAAAPIDPFLAPLAGNGGPTATHALLAGSPAIDGGNPVANDPAACESTDQRGHARPGVGTGSAACDIGAYERDVTAGPDLAVGKTAATSIAYVGQPIVYTMSAVNNGGAAAAGVVITDTLPAELTASSATSSQGSCIVGAHLVTCQIGAIAPGVAATVTVTAIAQAAGALRNSVIVTSAPGGGAPPGGVGATSDVSLHEPIVVNTTLQAPGNSGDCTLGEAIQAANTDRPVDACRAGSGRDLILLSAGTYLMTTVGSQDREPCCGGPYTSGPNALPLITSEMEIRGAGEGLTFLERDANAPDMRFFQVPGKMTLSGILTLGHMTIRGGRATAAGGVGYNGITVDGGAILGGTITTDHVVFDNNVANGSGGVLYGGRLIARDSRFQNNVSGGTGGVISDGTLDAFGSTFAGNSSGTYGGVYYGCPGVVVLNNSSVTGNSATGAGGAIHAPSCYFTTAIVTITDSVLSGNIVAGNSQGGAIAGDGLLTITRSRFLNNVAGFSGGAIGSAAGTITDSVFSGNQATDGAALYSGTGSLVVRGGTFDANTASRFGGAMLLRNSAVTLTNVTITNNAAAQGGAVYYQATAGPLLLNNVTLTTNSAQYTGGGIWHVWNGADVRLRNSIVALNTSGAGSAPDDLAGDGNPFHSDGYNLIGNGDSGPYLTGPGDQVGTAAAPIDPLLGPLQNNGGPALTRALLPGSPAIDAGSPALPGTSSDACDFLDARGVPRPQGARCDAGAFEVLPTTTSVAADLSLTGTAAPDPAVVGQNLTYTVVAQNLGPSDAHGVNVQVTLPSYVRFVSASASAGTFTQPGQRVIFNAGILPAGASATLTVITVPIAIGEQTFTATVTAIEPDPSAANNTASSSLISERAATLDLRRISPARGGDTGLVFVGAFGSGFVPGMTVELVRAGGTSLRGSLGYVDTGGTALTVLFDLRGQPQGRWDFVVTNPGVGSITLPEAFTIEEGHRPDIYVDVLSRDSIRPGETITITFVVGNRGNGDAFGIPLNLSLPAAMGVLPGFPAPSHPPPPGSEAYDPAALPRTTPTTGASGEPMTTFPLYIPVIRAGDRLVYRFSIGVPRNTTAGSITVESKSFRGTIESATGAAEVAAAADRELAALFRTASIVSGPSADSGAGAADVNPCSKFGPSPPWAACAMAVTNELLSFGGLFTGGASGCVAGVVGNLLQAGLSMCETVFTFDPHNDDDRRYVVQDTLQSAIATMAGIAASCFEGGFKTLNVVMNAYSLITGAFDIAQKCFDIPIDASIAKRIAIIRSSDPNEKAGPVGAGSQRFLTNLEPLRYMVFFENKPEATAAAQTVVVTDQLDPNVVDLATFSFGSIAFGDTIVALPVDQTDVTKDVDLRPAKNLIVRIHAALDATGLVTWQFQSLDPATGAPTTDTLAGFLPPDVNSPEGAGSVMFFVQPKPGLAAGTSIPNSARIVFDLNDPIDTNAWVNTIDNSTPTSAVTPLAPVQDAPGFLVSWNGIDSGSGVRNFTVKVATDGGPFTEWLVNSEQTSATFEGHRGHRYAFSSTARDNAGNEEAAHASVDASTAVALLAVDDNHTTNQDTQLTVAAPGLLANDDAGPNGATPFVVADPQHGTVTVNPDGAFVYSPNPGYHGSDSFSYQISDGSIGSNSATVVIGVAARTDTTAPTITAAATTSPNAAGWYSGSVTVHFTCTDTGSGIPSGACPADQTLTAEGGAVASVAQTVTDAAGNTSAPSNVVTVKIDKTAPTLSPVVSPTPILLNGAATIVSGAADALSGLASQSCGALVTSSVGTKSVNCAATDKAGNTTSTTTTYSVIYRFDGFLQPINDSGHPTCAGCPFSIFKGGSTVPVKFQLKDANGKVVQSVGPVVWVTPAKGGPTAAAIDESAYSDPATSGATYRWADSQYIYNWSTKGVAVGFFWRIGVLLDDGHTYFVSVGVK